MSKAHDVHALGQSLWIDYMRRQFVDDGGLESMIKNGVRGVTSNPTIFEKAIAGSSDYDEQLRTLVAQGSTTAEIYEALAIEDIQKAADLMRPVYDESKASDGYVSLEVSPELAHNTEETISEARRLHQLLDRPNVMIKVPATEEGVPAIEELIADGISVNVTLLFSLAHYEAVVEAYLRGLERRLETEGDLSRIASVASFFISRVEGKVDAALEEAGRPELEGKTALANAKLAYKRFGELFSGERWNALEIRGAQLQRPLWASTGVKNPAYPDTMYVDELIGAHTVNTLPPETLDAVLDHGTAAPTLEQGMERAQTHIDEIASHGIDLSAITAALQEEGVGKFADSFRSLMESIEQKRKSFQQDSAAQDKLVSDFELGAEQEAVETAFTELRREAVMDRIWIHDYRLWKNDPQEISNRLGWLHIADRMQEPEVLDEIRRLADTVRQEGYRNVLLLGMGGSSLAPEVFRKTFGVAEGYPDLHVLDSTDPDAVAAYDAALDPATTLYIVATKSGGTSETLSFFAHFYNQLAETSGVHAPGRHFIAITDPGSSLETLAKRYEFRKTFLNDPNIGGRYSALSHFGLVPAGLIGVDLEAVLDRATTAAVNCDRFNCPVVGDNMGGRLGAVMGHMAGRGRDKLTFVTSPAISAFGDWVEQLIAESTGKEQTGIVPIVHESLGDPATYGDDRVFVQLRLAGDGADSDSQDSDSQHNQVAALIEAGHPVVRMTLRDRLDVGAHFFLWEMATAVAGVHLGINPFDQPNVESAKQQARGMIDFYRKEGSLPAVDEIVAGTDAATALPDFLGGLTDGGYIALHAYVPPTEDSYDALNTLRETLRKRHRTATTLGYGPRFLHSTGQLHKGDGGNGLFIQFINTSEQDVPIPDEAGHAESTMSFGTLKRAQMLGDRQALIDAGRRVLTVELNGDVAGELRALSAALR